MLNASFHIRPPTCRANIGWKTCMVSTCAVNYVLILTWNTPPVNIRSAVWYTLCPRCTMVKLIHTIITSLIYFQPICLRFIFIYQILTKKCLALQDAYISDNWKKDMHFVIHVLDFYAINAALVIIPDISKLWNIIVIFVKKVKTLNGIVIWRHARYTCVMTAGGTMTVPIIIG